MLSARWRFFALIPVLLLVDLALRAEPKADRPPRTTLYHADADHLWNRLHAALLMRIGPDGKQYGEDRLEPLLWTDSRYLVSGNANDRLTAVLSEFVEKKGETLIDDPLKKAILQRDLWLVYNWFALAEANERRPTNRLPSLLANVIGRLALSHEEVAKLPDNYTAAVKSKQFADRFDSDKPDESYLPPDLFDPDGPWVCFGRTDGPTAPQHLREDQTNRFTNSVFLTFLKLPSGRAATLEHLQKLAKFDGPLFVENTDKTTKRDTPFVPAPNLPQWPKATEVALVRRAMLIDAGGRVVPTPITESVQIRVTRTEQAVPTAQELRRFDSRNPRSTFAEFRLTKSGLFVGKAGGLFDASEISDFKTGFVSKWDEFEIDRRDGNRPFPSGLEKSRVACIGCYWMPGVYSLNSFHEEFAYPIRRIVNDSDPTPEMPTRKAHPLAVMSVGEVEKAAVKWKESRPNRALMRK